jgi:tripartite-type tricarboxylate transporter receptor subunit TctC
MPASTIGHCGSTIVQLEKSMISKRIFGIATAGLCFGLWANPAGAQSYPNKVIKMIVPAGPGGPTDVLARATARHMQFAFGQSVIIENNAGAGGIIAAKAVARAIPDGHTLLFANTTLLAVIPAVTKSPAYDPIRDFASVAKVGDTFQVLVTNPTFLVNSVQELLAYAKANPGKLNYSSGGHGTVPHLAGEMFKSSAGIDVLHIPLRSDAEAITAILGSQVHLSFVNVTIALPLIQEGTLKALAVTSATRRSDLPNVPTMSESGVANYVVTSFFGVVAPTGTPSNIVNKLNVAINEALRSSEMQVSLAKLGVEASPQTPQEFAAFIAAETQKWTTVATTAGIKID